MHIEHFLSLPKVRAFPEVRQSGRAVMLIPIFQDAYAPPWFVECLVKAGIYARLACLVHSDAVAEGVPVKFYVEDVLRAEIDETLSANGVDLVQDVITFSAREIDTGVPAYLSKKTCFFSDERFQLAEWVFVMDCDYFFCPPSIGGQPRFFERMFTQPPAFGCARIQQLGPGWQQGLANTMYQGHIGADRMLQLLGLDATTADHVQMPFSALMAYPAWHFHQHHAVWIDWIRQYGLYIGDDQRAIALSMHKFGVPMWSIEATLGFSNQRFLQLASGETGYQAVHGNLEEDQDLVKALELTRWSDAG